MTTNVSQLFRGPGRITALAIVLAPVIAAMAVSAGGDAARELLLYDRSRVLADAHWWRPITAQLVHLGPAHLAGNLLAWLGLCALLQPRVWTAAWLAVAAGALVVTAMGLLLTPDIGWYAGLSGALHGVAAGGALLLALGRRDTGVAAVLLGLVATKLAWELLVGPLPGEHLPEGARVVVEAHAWGAAGGGGVGLMAGLLQRRRARV